MIRATKIAMAWIAVPCLLGVAYFLPDISATGQTTAPEVTTGNASIEKPAVATPSPPKCPESVMPASSSNRTPKDSILAGMGGQRVVLHDDGTWQYPQPSSGHDIDGVTDNGQSVRLSRSVDTNGCVIHKWTTLGSGGGLIQILVTRAITTDPSVHNNRDNCIPVISVRNLNANGLDKVIAEIQFTAPDGTQANTSILFGPLDHGEESEHASAPLFVRGCVGLVGVVTIPYCTLENDADCQAIVRASDRGVIPLKIAPKP
jgi:hypothetical protein